uniref:RNA polymerase II transcription factor B subunit 2 n=2 Tax=Auxenochlorella protothecoides TaxID=3075 RepID=A0A1D2ACB1_AUXPR
MDIIEYLESLPTVKVAPLYTSSIICRVILQHLPPLAAQYVARLLLVPEGTSEALISSWPTREAATAHEVALETLVRLNLFQGYRDKLGQQLYRLHDAFRDHICASGSARGLAWNSSLQDVPRANVTPESIADYAQKRWEEILLFLVGSASTIPATSANSRTLDVPGLLVALGLMSNDGPHHQPRITEAGFKYLLLDTFQQLWTLLRQYAAQVEGTEASLAVVLEFLLQLGSLGCRPLVLQELPPVEQGLALDMCQLGLLMPSQHGTTRLLLATPLARVLAEGGTQPSGTRGFVIVETNFRVYAYTSSAVQQAILQFFVRCDVLLPNLFVGSITRESVLEALESGATGDQIVAYLRQHAHPRVEARVPTVPGVVTDQIRLWDKELRRLQATRSVLYSNFESADLFRRFAEAVRHLAVYVGQEKQQVVVPAEHHEHCKAEIKALKLELGI